MKLLDTLLIAGLCLAVGWISAGMWYTRLPRDCPVIQGNVHLAMIVNTNGSYVCQYQPQMWGVVNMKVNRS